MTFKELLDAAELAGELFATALEALKKAEIAVAQAQTSLANAQAQKTSSDSALSALLVEKGVHFLQDKDGTLSTYHPLEVEPGWCKQQPIPGAMPGKGK
jgi:hypothetical protein